MIHEDTIVNTPDAITEYTTSWLFGLTFALSLIPPSGL